MQHEGHEEQILTRQYEIHPTTKNDNPRVKREAHAGHIRLFAEKTVGWITRGSAGEALLHPAVFGANSLM